MNISRMFWLLLLISFGGVCHGEECVSSVPRAAREIISNFGGWKVVQVTDLPEDDQKLWQTSHVGKCPGLAAGDFTGDEKLSYAIALIRDQPSGQILEQLVLLAPDGNSFRHTVLVEPTNVVSPFVTWKVDPGTYEGANKGKSFQAAHDSFIYEKIEAHATQYYYDGGRLHSIVTAN